MNQQMNTNLEITTLGGGCFWCLEAVFDQLSGVVDVVSGYAGGSTPRPSYQQVCTGVTGHAEVVQVTYDPGLVTFREILEVFFTIHDPTTLNRQGADMGTQYRSVIFYHSEQQKETASEIMAELQGLGLWDQPVVTQLVPLINFYPAEDYHQNYFVNNPGQGYCRAIVAPKVAKFRQKYLYKLKN